ncbi:TPA: LysR family transcriptional regulator [Pluralibacter gergoviae]|uniref:LysR substrate-binding domain-containing protein n=1 Tax=Pluralibacter gergoviae TaxID=61647 RepID=UPI0004F78579|nr:LysR substrate-binding domain-containing protein [Pluralibacter gergoviae]AIR00852.1 LysR family transcriptional regulator [Pluralibacter gergoviae]EKT9638755.1 LysR family transcriptional regulator [Pluralibacter gergoviae]EKV3542636.1 LysR family transcriptional regulator [Pluralibacter gergoviae]EKV9901345.1 LysR family transcriptional regulator [Pluralibacter gergoviae]EKV9932582.1 LysR family transcriptional regulator [Pluralibacter gergoviae]
MHFDITDLKLFLAISEEGSLTRGAEKTHLSAASASVRIRNLEESINARLLYRSSQGVALTPAGETLRHHARQLLNQMAVMRSDMQEHGKGIKGLVRIFASITAVAEYLPPLLSRYLAQYSDVDIDLREYPSPEIVRSVLEGKTDLGIVAGSITTDSLELLPFRTDRLVLVAPVDHPLAERKSVSFAESMAYAQISLPEGTGMYEFIRRQAEQAGSALKIRIQVGNFETFCRMVEAQVGIGVMPYSAASRLGQLHRFAIIDLNDLWSLRRLHLCARRFDRLPGYARQLVTLLMPPSQGAGYIPV